VLPEKWLPVIFEIGKPRRDVDCRHLRSIQSRVRKKLGKRLWTALWETAPFIELGCIGKRRLIQCRGNFLEAVYRRREIATEN